MTARVDRCFEAGLFQPDAAEIIGGGAELIEELLRFCRNPGMGIARAPQKDAGGDEPSAGTITLVFERALREGDDFFDGFATGGIDFELSPADDIQRTVLDADD